MQRTYGRGVEVETLADFDALIAGGARRMHGWCIQGVDLTGRTEELLGLDPAGSMLLGDRVDAIAERHLRSGGALIFPEVPELPFDPYRSGLYTPDELFDSLAAAGYDATTDARVYAWSHRSPGDAAFAVARALHDHAIDDALAECLADRRTVGVMGGHTLARGTSGYAAAARLGRELARAGLMVATGGGPGAMEAANLGAYLAEADNRALDDALAVLEATPSFRPSIGDWAREAFVVRARWPDGGRSIGIPTWFYGHEPPNAFATDIAKYFQNSVREATLLRYCEAGIVFLPGAGGTVQEIFQDACENFYADRARVSAMVLVGVEHWDATVPAWPLLRALADGRPMAEHVHLVDSVEDVPALLSPR